MSFNICVCLWNHHTIKIMNTSFTPKVSMPLLSLPIFHLLGNYWSTFWRFHCRLPFLGFYINNTMEYMLFFLASFIQPILGFIHSVLGTSSSYHLFLLNAEQYSSARICCSLSYAPSWRDTWAASRFGLFQIKPLWTLTPKALCRCMPSFSWINI